MTIDTLDISLFLKDMARKKNMVLRKRRTLICVLSPLLASGFIFSAVLWSRSPYAGKLLLAFGLLVCFRLIAWYSSAFRLRLNDQQIGALMACNSLSALEPLLDLLPYCNGKTRQTVKHTVVRLLDALKDGDADLLTSAVRNRLYLVLQFYDLDANADLLIATIRALRVIDDRNASELIRGWAHIASRSSDANRVKKEAQDFITANLARGTPAGACLLRSAANENQSTVLIRPASTGQASDSDSNTLLLADSDK